MCPFIFVLIPLKLFIEAYMNIEILKAKKGVRFVSLANDAGMEIVLCSFGASIYSLKMDLEQMVVTPKEFPTFFQSGKYYGMTIGRIAGRIPNGILKVNDKEYHLEQNEGLNCLHGGFHSISRKNWGLQIQTTKNYALISFYLTTKKGEAGFNGKADYVVTYRVYNNENIFEINYEAKCKEDTYFALTNHSYFNLGNDKNILNHKLRIKANEVSTFNFEDFTINGYKPVAGTIFDFREGKVLRKDIENIELHNVKWLNGYDHRFHLYPVENAEANISLQNGNYYLNIYTDFDAVHLYTGGFTEHDLLLDDDYDDIYKGMALECSNLSPEFVKKGEIYQHRIKYQFRRKTDEI